MPVRTNISLMPLLLVGLLFLGQNMLDLLHYPQSDPTSGAIYRLHPVTYLLFFLWGCDVIRFKSFYRLPHSIPHVYGIVILLVFVYSITLGKSKANFYILDTLFAPVLLILYVHRRRETIVPKLYKLLRVFFILNCVLAIAERGRSAVFFPLAQEPVFEAFRSFALLGHPLNNALVTSFLTLFFVVMAQTTTKKFLYFGLGMLALFSFGARASLGSMALAFPFLLYFDLKRHSAPEASKRLFSYLVLMLVVVAAGWIVLTATSFGERIFATSQMDDDSADVRARVFDMFRHFTTNDLLLGITEQQIMTAMYLEKVDIIENFWIIWIFKYGIVLTAILGIALVAFFYSLFLKLDVGSRIVFTLSFLLAASGNNSLATNTTALSIITIAALTGFKAYLKETETNVHDIDFSSDPRLQPQRRPQAMPG